MFARFRPDNFTLALIFTIILASLLPARGDYAALSDHATSFAVALLFFLHGACLSRQAMTDGLRHWRLHVAIFCFTFLIFPALGLLAKGLAPWAMPETLAMGVMFLACQPSTLQSSIAFTSIAGGNVPAAICSASASNLIGVFMTPLLVALLLQAHGGGFALHSLWDIMAQLLLPFIAGQVARRWVGAWVEGHRKLVGLTDRASILMVVYNAFSESVTHGLWHQISPTAVPAMVAADVVLLAVVLLATTHAARWFGFNRADEIAIVFCGSKKSLASGVPIANILFAGPKVGMIVLPLMLFHQIQLMACAALARRYARRDGAAAAE